ncbi:substrate-binding domain-containing protein [Verrucomicrobiaceae bacterium N1E253]|uniref:Substrate-binding domain-containing protein n=1 Tax=Oceaniferula marina TaxID=2748318 RepID=A0A851GAW2_9BACT|nr:substrate-binding domain-containing protein [Oceaniferula marina]NWK54753.1 substrate-binding domain-containing protein [Oceaniferula marina]
MKLPQRRSLTAETAEVIREMIRSGEIKQKLPGERDLAARLQIGRDTLRTALAELEKTGWLSVGEHGKRRQILKKASSKQAEHRSRRVGFLSPKRLEDLPPTMLLEIDHMREMLARKEFSLEFHTPAIFSLKRPGSRLKELVDSLQYDAWILYQSNEHVQAWFAKQKIPCMVRGLAYPGVKLPSLDVDWQATGFHAASLLMRYGHRSIGYMVPDTQLQGLFAAQKGIENAVANASGDVTLHTIVEQGTAEAVATSLHQMCHEPIPPTAIIATRSRQVLTLISWMASHQLRIPQNMSLVSLTYDNVFDALVPGISHYTMDRATIARGGVRKLESVMKGQGLDEKLLIPDFVLGGSVKKYGA